MGNIIPKVIIPDNEIATVALRYWPESSRYQATIMMTIALMESSGDARAWYYNLDGIFVETFDRGLWGINEQVIENIAPGRYDASAFSNPDLNGQMARIVWDWRYNHAPQPGTSLALPYAYSAWTTYRKARVDKDPQYVAAWSKMFARAAVAVGWPVNT